MYTIDIKKNIYIQIEALENNELKYFFLNMVCYPINTKDKLTANITTSFLKLQFLSLKI